MTCCCLIGDGADRRNGAAFIGGRTVDQFAGDSGVLNWNKNALHLIGIGAPTQVAQRARIAPPSGTYTQATFGSGNFVVVTGAGMSVRQCQSVSWLLDWWHQSDLLDRYRWPECVLEHGFRRHGR